MVEQAPGVISKENSGVLVAKEEASKQVIGPREASTLVMDYPIQEASQIMDRRNEQQVEQDMTKEWAWTKLKNQEGTKADIEHCDYE